MYSSINRILFLLRYSSVSSLFTSVKISSLEEQRIAIVNENDKELLIGEESSDNDEADTLQKNRRVYCQINGSFQKSFAEQLGKQLAYFMVSGMNWNQPNKNLQQLVFRIQHIENHERLNAPKIFKTFYKH